MIKPRSSIFNFFYLLFISLVLTSNLSCRGEGRTHNPNFVATEMKVRKDFKKLKQRLRFSSNIPVNPQEGAFDDFEANDDISRTYDKAKGLKLNYVKTDKLGHQPLLVFIPPGSFLKYDEDEHLTMKMCRDFARAGFNTASVSYSKLTSITMEDFYNSFSDSFLGGFGILMRAKIAESFVDVAKAITYLKNHRDELDFDPNQIYLVGHSAGGIIALHSIFSTNTELEKYVKGNNFDFSGYERPDVQGAVSISGALMSGHYDDKDVSNTPVLLFHGDKDETVPYAFGKAWKKLIKDTKIPTPGMVWEVIFNSKGEKQSSLEGIHVSYIIPKWMLKFSIGLALPEMIGSKNIYDDAPKNVKLVEVRGGKHVFMVNEDGSINKTYYSMRQTILDFIKNHSK